MAFPNNPVNNQVWSEGGRQYRYSATLPGWLLSGAAGGDQDFGGNRAIHLADAVDQTDAVNLKQLEMRAMRAGDLGGTVASTIVEKIQGQTISTTAPTAGQQLRFAGGAWTPTTNTVELSGDVTADADASAGAITTTVERIRGSNVSTTAPNNNNQFLKWNQAANQWEPSFVQSLQNRGVASAVPNQNDVLAYVGTQWQPVTGGAGLTDAPAVPAGVQYARKDQAWEEITDIDQLAGIPAGTATNTLPTTVAQKLTAWLGAARNNLAWLTARFTAAGEANALNLTTARTITVDPTATAAASFTGAGNVSAGVSVAIAAGTATATLPTATAQALSSWLAVARNNLAWLTARFTAAGEANALNLTTARTITVDPTITTAASFTGAANVSAGPSLAIAAGTATATLPVTTASSLSTWLTTARNNLLYAVTPNLTAGTASNALPTAGTATALWTLLNTIRNCLDWCQQRAGAIPTGGAAGHVLQKTGADNFTARWAMPCIAVSPTSVTAVQNTWGGESALQVNTASQNTAYGFQAMELKVGGAHNTALGAWSMAKVTEAVGNTAVGYSSLRELQGNTQRNVAVGWRCGQYIGATGTTNFTGGIINCTLVGYQVRISADGLSNAVVIGYDAIAVGGNNSVTIGNANSTGLHRTQVAWTTGISDVRGKEEIEAADLDRCLDTVKALPVKRWKWRDWVPQIDRHETGWIADDVEKVFPKSVVIADEHYPDDHVIKDCKHHNAHHEALPTLWGAVQKLIEKNERLEQEIAELRRH